MIRSARALLLVFSFPAFAAAQPRPGSDGTGGPDPNAVRPIPAVQSPWIEKLTWMEVRDAIRAGKTTVIIPTGGVEQNGPWLVTAKHNIILQTTAEAVAGKLGNTLIAPIVPFVPEGAITAEGQVARYPGTISVTEETFERLLTDIAASLRLNGFKEIIFIGDSGGNQTGMKTVTAALSKQWTDGKTKVYFIPEYYNWVNRQKWLMERGIHEQILEAGLHDEYSADALMMLTDPATIRMDQRLAAGKFTINGVDLNPKERTMALGWQLADFVATVTVDAIHKARGATTQAQAK